MRAVPVSPGRPWPAPSRRAAAPGCAPPVSSPSDHSLGRAWTLSADHDAEAWAAAVSALVGGAGTRAHAVRADETRVAQARHDPQEYAALIERCRDLIRAGIAYQLCLTTRFTVRGAHDAVDVYHRLRTATPRPPRRIRADRRPHAAERQPGAVPPCGRRHHPHASHQGHQAPEAPIPSQTAALAAELATDRKEPRRERP